MGKLKRVTRTPGLSLAEMMTIVVFFQLSGCKDFKNYYKSFILGYLKPCFPKAVTYDRFIALMPRTFMPLLVLSQVFMGKKTGKYFVDSGKLQVCHNLRISRNKVFKGLAKRGKTSTGWFFGFKLHLIINEKGEIVKFCISPGNTHDTKVVASMAETLEGWLFADRGYISQPLAEALKKHGLLIFTKVRQNMKLKLLTPLQKLYLSKRNLVETVIGQLKAICSLEHSRHRSSPNFFINIFAAIVAYSFKQKKPSLNLHSLSLLSTSLFHS